jgi:hypothetical protein
VVSRKHISVLESLLLLILCGFALAFLLETTKLQQTAALFPRLVSEASLFVFVVALAGRLRTSSTAAIRAADSTSEQSPQNAMSLGAALTLQAGYVAAFFFVGFPLATLMYLIACPRLMGYERWKILFPYAVLLTSTVFLAFAYILHVRFPAGLVWR